MNTKTLTQTRQSSPTHEGNSERSSLFRLSLSRGVVAIIWAVAWSRAQVTLDAMSIALLVVYPLIDAGSSLIDYRTHPHSPERRITGFNGVLSTVAAIAMGLAAARGVAAALVAFGAWAVISGAAQLAVGLQRRGPTLGKQWPMLIAGGLSFIVGIFYIVQATGEHPSLEVFSVYATGGGVFFIVQAGLLAWRTRQLRGQTA
jgi:uncharacterized membrane protein HdeD (DUF308 family)